MAQVSGVGFVETCKHVEGECACLVSELQEVAQRLARVGESTLDVVNSVIYRVCLLHGLDA